MFRTLFRTVLLTLFFSAIFSKRSRNQQSTLQPQNPDHKESYSTYKRAAQETEDRSATTQESRLSKPKCGLQFSGYVHNSSSCVTIACNFILVSRHWAFMLSHCAISDASGGVSHKKFTMGQLSHENEKESSLVQTVHGEKIIPHTQIPVVMVKLAPSFLPNDCFKAWLPVSPPQSKFYNVSVAGYRGKKPEA